MFSSALVIRIRDSFVETKKIFDDDYGELSIEDRDAKISEAENNFSQALLGFMGLDCLNSYKFYVYLKRRL